MGLKRGEHNLTLSHPLRGGPPLTCAGSSSCLLVELEDKEDKDFREVLKRSIADRGGSRDAQQPEEATATQPRGGACLLKLSWFLLRGFLASVP